MAGRLQGRKVAVLATDGFEQVELTKPVEVLRAAGAEVHVIAPKAGEIQGVKGDDKGDRVPVDRTVGQARAADYHALVLPGGTKNPDRLRTDAAAVAFVRQFVELDKPVAAICHGPWMLVEADAVRGRTLTSWPSLKTDIRNAGGDWVDEMVHVDQKLVTSRKPDDLPAFCQKLVDILGESSAQNVVDEAAQESFPASDPPAWTASSVGGTGASASPPAK